LRAGATESNGRWIFRLNGFDEIEPLLRALREAACVIDDLRLTQADLEDVFVGVMQGENDRENTRERAGEITAETAAKALAAQ
jgi:hypothetical protein